MKKTFFTLILSGIILTFSACKSGGSLQTYQTTRFGLGTVIEITVLDDSEEPANMAIEAAMTEINRIGSLFYEGNPESPLYEFSHRTGDGVSVKPDSARAGSIAADRRLLRYDCRGPVAALGF